MKKRAQKVVRQRKAKNLTLSPQLLIEAASYVGPGKEFDKLSHLVDAALSDKLHGLRAGGADHAALRALVAEEVLRLQRPTAALAPHTLRKAR